jgi:hypothetical protein
VGESVLQIAPDAAAAYSLRSLTGGDPNVVRVRRESDNTEKDFSGSQIESGEMARWVNEQPTLPLDLRELDTNTGERDGALIQAAAAYSLRKLKEDYTGDVVEVRRNVDGETEGFTAAEVTDGTLENFVNASFDDELPLDQATGAAAAYSLRNLSASGTDITIDDSSDERNGETGKYVVQVRRSSDDNVKSFTAAEVADDESPNVVDLYAISGQSNAAGRANTSDAGNRFDDLDALSNRVFIWNRGSSSFEEFDFGVNQHKTGGSSNQFGPESELLRLAASDNPNKTIYVVKYTEGGTSLYNDWDSEAGSNYYSDFVGDYNNAVSNLSSQGLNIRHRGVLYAQGERDSKNDLGGGVASYYKDKQKALVENLRTDLNQPSLPVALTLISVRGTLGDTYTHIAEVNQAKEQVASELNNVTTISSLNFGFKSDDLHYNGDGQIAHGAAFFEYTDSFEYNSALETWVGDGNDGFVRKWYDQSGSGNDATAATSSKQPKIVNGGHSVGGIKFDGVDDLLAATSGGFFGGDGVNISQPISFFSVIEGVSSGGFFGGDGAEFEVHSGGTSQYVLHCGSPIASSSNQAVGDIDLLSGLANSSSSLLRKNGTVIASGDSGTAGVSDFYIGVADRISRYTDGVIKEIVIYDSDQSDKRRAIEENIANHYDITLAAYSRDGTVSTWYDQSGNTNDAVQTDTAKQPKIVEGGNLLKDSRNNPAIDFDDVDDNMDLTSDLVASGAYSAIAYHEFSSPSIILKGNLNVPRIRLTSATNYNIGSYSPTVSQDFTVASTLGLVSVLKDASHNARVYANGTESSSGQQNVGSGSSPFTMLGTEVNNGAANGKLVEIIYYESDQSDNRTAIEANIGETYGITDIPAADDTVNGFVQTWYDQSGSSNDAEQSAASSQPKIVDGGTLIKRNNNPAVESTSDNYLGFTLDSLSADGQQSVFAVLENDVTSQNGFSAVFRAQSTSSTTGGANRRPWWFVNPTGGLAFTVDSTSGYQNSDRNYRLYSHVMNDDNGGTSTVHKDGTQVDTRAITLDANSTFSDGRIAGVNTNATGSLYMSEVIYYTDDQSSNRPAIETNIANQYGITLS